jgi:hypothetical protein
MQANNLGSNQNENFSMNKDNVTEELLQQEATDEVRTDQYILCFLLLRVITGHPSP